MLLNLLLNAFDAIGRDGQVTIRIAEDSQGYSVITVSDSGTGISQAVRDRVFEPFISTKESGTGLGLTICRRIVEDHCGRIEAADGRAGGAIFTVTLPIDRTLPTAGTLPISSTPTTSGPTDANPLGR